MLTLAKFKYHKYNIYENIRLDLSGRCRKCIITAEKLSISCVHGLRQRRKWSGNQRRDHKSRDARRKHQKLVY
jgi:hypothetical protein